MKTLQQKSKVDVVYDWKHQSENGKAAPVWIRVYYDRKRKYVTTGVKVLPANWSDKLWVVNRDDAYQLNLMIREQYEKCLDSLRNLIDRGEEPTAKKMKVNRSDTSFLDWLERAIRKADSINDKTRKHHYATLRLLNEFGKMNSFNNVTQPNIEEWIKWISEREVNKPCADGKIHPTKIKQCTVFDHWKRLHKYLQQAAKERHISRDTYEFISVPRGEYGIREHLSDEEINRLLNTKMPLPHLEMVRLRYIVQMSCGLAYSDFFSKDFTRAECIRGNWCLADRRMKTKNDFFAIILPFAIPILEQWGWVIPPISNVDYNKFLDRVAVICGINKHLTSHTARHTYACYCLRHGVRIEAVQRTLGHKRLETTQIYATLADSDVLDAFDKLK